MHALNPIGKVAGLARLISCFLTTRNEKDRI
jgi:hypothetical protein